MDAQTTQVAGNVVDALLNVFQVQMFDGHKGLQGLASWLMVRLIVINLVFLGIGIALSGIEGFSKFIRQIFLIGTISYCISNWPYIVQSITGFFITVGELGAGKNPGSLLLNPADIAERGFLAFNNVMTFAKDNGGWLGIKVVTLVAFFAALLQLIGYVVIATVVIVYLLEFWIVAHLALAFLPFALFRQGAFLAEKAFTVCISFGVKFMVLTFVLSVADGFLYNAAQASYSSDNLVSLFLPVVAVFLILVLAFHAPSVASGILSGSPSLGGGALLSTAGIAAAGTGAAVAVAKSGVVGGAQGAAAIIRNRHDPVGAASGAIKGAVTSRFEKAKEALGFNDPLPKWAQGKPSGIKNGAADSGEATSFSQQRGGAGAEDFSQASSSGASSAGGPSGSDQFSGSNGEQWPVGARPTSRSAIKEANEPESSLAKNRQDLSLKNFKTGEPANESDFIDEPGSGKQAVNAAAHGEENYGKKGGKTFDKKARTKKSSEEGSTTNQKNNDQESGSDGHRSGSSEKAKREAVLRKS